MEELESLREDILRAALSHVPFDGWSWTALRRAAADGGHDAFDLERAFPGGPAELVAFHSRTADRRMMEALEGMELEGMRVRDRVATAIRMRLEQNASDREAVRRGVTFLALPQNAPLGLRLLYRTVDAIWYAAGDTSTDFNYYTKRALLAGVYSAVLLYWLDDNSEDFVDSWAFLDRRIDEVMRLPAVLSRAAGPLRRLPNPFRLLRPRRSY